MTLSDGRRPPRRGFGVAIAHVYPSTLFGDAIEEVRRTGVHTVKALGLREGVAYPQVLWSEDGVARLIEVAARIPAGQMDSVARYGVGVELIDIALLQALGRPVPDEMVAAKMEQPMAISFLTAEPGPLRPASSSASAGSSGCAPSQASWRRELYFQDGETIRPVQLDGDRRGYVIALGGTNLEAVERAESAARLLDVEVEAA